MSKFSHIAARKVTDSNTADFDLFEIGMGSLTLAPATRSNKPFSAALIALMAPSQKRIQSGRISAEFVDRYRADLIPLYAKHVVKGWKGVTDEAGKEVPFSADMCTEFLQALPNQIFDGIVAFAENESNFGSFDQSTLEKN